MGDKRMQEFAGVLPKSHFASDNAAGICPEAWAAMAAANDGYTPGYGDDEITARVCDLFRKLFERDSEVFFTFNGTAANALALASLCQSYHSIICHEHAHVETDECGGPEFFSNGTKILVGKGGNGKISPESVSELVLRRTDVHYPKPRVLSLTEPTEMGTVYTPTEIKALSRVCKKHGLRLHMDGARFANAVASLGVKPAEISWKAGVDVLCFGGTKNGLAVGEAVIFFDRKLALEFDYRCKQAGQLASKMRYLSAPWLGLLQTGAWLSNAENANRHAKELEAGFRRAPGAQVLYPVQANGVFVKLTPRLATGLRKRGWRFYDFIGGGSRFMCSWNTTDADVRGLLSDVRDISGR
jgi:threonine aldolase